MAALCLFVEDVMPEPFVYDEAEPPIAIHLLVREVLAPKAMLPVQAPLLLEDKHTPTPELHGITDQSSIMGSGKYKCVMPANVQAQQADNPQPQQQDLGVLRDMMTSVYGQLHEQSNINAHIWMHCKI